MIIIINMKDGIDAERTGESRHCEELPLGWDMYAGSKHIFK